jgi:phosphoenolpyruvate-protein kinase (PTS system EI component)
VGTNDLAHYTIALDREDGRVSASPLDPAVLRLLANTVAAAAEARIPCSLCGDMVTEPVALGLALGIGFKSVSVPVSMVSLAHAVIRRTNLWIAREVAADALGCSSAEEVRELLVSRLGADLDPLWKESAGR